MEKEDNKNIIVIQIAYFHIFNKGDKVDININLHYENHSIQNLAFIRALLIKYNIEKMNISYNQEQELRMQILKELQTEKGIIYEKEN